MTTILSVVGFRETRAMTLFPVSSGNSGIPVLSLAFPLSERYRLTQSMEAVLMLSDFVGLYLSARDYEGEDLYGDVLEPQIPRLKKLMEPLQPVRGSWILPLAR